jgi:integrase
MAARMRRLARVAAGSHVIQYNGRPVKRIRRAFRLVAAAAKVPTVTPHILKHTAVTWALRVASPWIVSGMTATSMRTLQAVYGKHMMPDLRAAADAVAHSSDPRNSNETEGGKEAQSC